MKSKMLLIFGLLIFMLSASYAQARTPIRGTIYGEQFGLIHLDYTTAARPDGYAGEQIDFYISPWDPEFTGPGLFDFTAQIFDLSDADKCNDSSCLLTGFLWNDRIGWIILDGEQIQNSMPDLTDFPEALFARVNFTGRLTGYAWSENAGWVKLAADEESGTNTPPTDQTADIWGVFLDSESSVTVVDRPDPERDITLGRPLQGYAWSESLGWIKFSPNEGESFTGLEGPGLSGGAFTNWLPDTSPPEFYAKNNVWFKTSHELGVVTWPAFASDPDSGIREDSVFTVTRDSRDEFAGCNNPLAVGQNLEGGNLSLTIPSIGLLQGATLGYCRYLLTGTIYNNAGLSFKIDEIAFSVRAGDYDATHSSLDGSDAGIAAIADGVDEVEYNLHLLDLADNPIVSIEEVNCSGCPGRNVTVTASFDNTMSFDTIALSDTFPVRTNGEYLGSRGEVITPSGGGILPEGDLYPLRINSFSPSTPLTSLFFQKFDVKIEEEELPLVSSSATLTGASERDYVFAKPEAMSNPTFLPALTAQSGQIQTGELLNQIIDGNPATLGFTLKNQSTETLNHFDLDTIFEYYGGEELALIETRAIDHEATVDESLLGWSDDSVAGLEGAHYELYKGALDTTGTLIHGANSIFHILFSYEDGTVYPSSIAEDGSYPVDAIWGIPDNRIDRNDAVDLSIEAETESPSQTIGFTPAFIFLPPEIDVNDVNLHVQQELAYRFESQPQFTIYKPDFLIEGIDVNSTGAQFKGIGVGEDIFSNSELEVIGSQGVQNLSEQMRRNVAEMTLNLDSCDVTTPLFESDGADDLTLKTSGSCFKVDSENNTVIAYYEGNENDILELGDGTAKTIFIPVNTRYTLVLKGGMNLYLRNNVAYEYEDDQSSLGIILLGASGKGANVYIDPAPTNMVGNLYAEGSLLSSPNPTDGLLYYGGENPSALSNQLYWQGSIASLNTLGGASSNLLPQGLTCPEDITPYQCAQRYDMNFIRRFSADPGTVANNGKFSGGGSCALGVCTPGSLPSTISLEGGLIETDSQSLDAFFIEPAARPSPPGFRLSGEQESSQVIR